MLVYYLSTKTLKIMEFGAEVDLVWIFGCEKKGSRLCPLDTISVTGTF